MGMSIHEFINKYEAKKKTVRALIILVARERRNPDGVRMAALEKWMAEAVEYLEHNLKTYQKYKKLMGRLRNGRPPRPVRPHDP